MVQMIDMNIMHGCLLMLMRTGGDKGRISERDEPRLSFPKIRLVAGVMLPPCPFSWNMLVFFCS
jgi:hypothetical protein